MMNTETVTVDEAAIEAEIQGTIKTANRTVQRRFDGIAEHTDDLKAAIRIRHQYLAENPGDAMCADYSILFTRVNVVAYLQDFAVLPAVLRLFARAGYKPAEGYKPPEQTGSGELVVCYDIGDRSHAIVLTMSPREVDGAVCELVKTGETVHPTYEIRCHGEPVVDTPEPKPAVP
jgi:hypothetical protein